ncbi:MAG: DUF362 domain-containing protein [bacterium]
MQSEKMARREFLKRAIMGATVLAAPPSLLSAYARGVFAEPIKSSIRSAIAAVTHSKSADDNGKIDPKVVRTMVDEGVKAITGKGNSKDAWLSLFPRLKSTDVIGIKINCINRYFHSDAEVVDAIIAGLRSIGVADNNIIVWDRTDWELISSGYEINDGTTGVRYMGTPRYDDSFVIKTGKEAYDIALLSTILTRECDHLINVPVLKDHDIAGVTLSMKNHYGTINTPGSCHGNNCDPYIAYINSTPHIKDKTRLIVLDALKGIYRGGPGGSPQWVNRQILLGTDPVAVDYEGMMIIEGKRLSKGMSSIVGRAHYIQTAAEMGLGTNNPEQITLHDLNLD